jgi:hypothetical protein
LLQIQYIENAFVRCPGEELLIIEKTAGNSLRAMKATVAWPDATNTAQWLSINRVIGPMTPKQLRNGRHGNSEYQETGADA